MNDLTIVGIRLGFLILLWIFVFFVVLALAKDISGGRGAKKVKKKKQPENPSAPNPQAPAKPTAKHLVVVDGPQQGTSLALSNSPVTLGRAEDSTFVLTDDYSSGRHARLFPQGSRWFIEDLGSTNGVTVNGAPLSRTTSVDINVPIQIGKTVLELKP